MECLQKSILIGINKQTKPYKAKKLIKLKVKVHIALINYLK